MGESYDAIVVGARCGVSPTAMLLARRGYRAETQALLAAVSGNQRAMDDFVSVQAGTLPIPEFFSPESIDRIMAAQGAAR
jgi:hypothetical protein